MSTDNKPVKFEWTDELVKEFYDFASTTKWSLEKLSIIEQFKQSKEELPLTKEEIKIENIEYVDEPFSHGVTILPSDEISKDKFGAIKILIENYLNNKFRVHSDNTWSVHSENQKTFTQKDIDCGVLNSNNEGEVYNGIIEKAAVYIEKYRWEKSMTSHRIARNIFLDKTTIPENKSLPTDTVKDNSIELLKEDIWCVHKYLDEKLTPRKDSYGNEYSIVGRIKFLEKYCYNPMIIKSDNICPVTFKQCTDECCPVGAVCNLSGEQPSPPEKESAPKDKVDGKEGRDWEIVSFSRIDESSATWVKDDKGGFTNVVSDCVGFKLHELLDGDNNYSVKSGKGKIHSVKRSDGEAVSVGSKEYSYGRMCEILSFKVMPNGCMYCNVKFTDGTEYENVNIFSLDKFPESQPKEKEQVPKAIEMNSVEAYAAGFSQGIYHCQKYGIPQ